jgi:hypothetical protein
MFLVKEEETEKPELFSEETQDDNGARSEASPRKS